MTRTDLFLQGTQVYFMYWLGGEEIGPPPIGATLSSCPLSILGAPLESIIIDIGGTLTEQKCNDITIYYDGEVIFIQMFFYKEPKNSKLPSIATTTMKFTVAALLAALTTTCLAQGINIGFPANNTSVAPGSNIIVQVIRGVSLWTPGWFTKRHWRWRYRTLWRPLLSLALWLGYSHATQFAFLLATHWEPFS